jgi:hypothetical protein
MFSGLVLTFSDSVADSSVSKNSDAEIAPVGTGSILMNPMVFPFRNSVASFVSVLTASNSAA